MIMRLRRLIVVLSLIAPVALLHAQETAAGGWFILEGRITGQDTGIIQLQYRHDSTGYYINDTSVVSGGRFFFKGYVKEPTLAFLIGNIRSTSMDDPNRKLLFLEPGHLHIRLSPGQFQHAVVTGSGTQDELEQVNTQIRTIHEAIMALKKERAGIRENDTSPAAEQLRGALRTRYDSLLKLEYRIEYSFAGNHPNSYLSPYLIIGYRNQGVTVDSARKLYNSFSPFIQQSFYGVVVRDLFTAQENSVVSHPAPDFKRKDINDRWISCSSFKGEKYVLIDFWFSACVPCRELSPHLRDLYSKYHDKGLEIISISSDIDARTWKKAIVKDSTGGWIHIGRYLNEKCKPGEIESQYGVSAWPALVLIDKKGYILGRYAGGEDEPVSSLDDLLKELL